MSRFPGPKQDVLSVSRLLGWNLIFLQDKAVFECLSKISRGLLDWKRFSYWFTFSPLYLCRVNCLAFSLLGCALDWLVIVTFNSLNKILVAEEVQEYFLVGNPQVLWYNSTSVHCTRHARLDWTPHTVGTILVPSRKYQNIMRRRIFLQLSKCWQKVNQLL